jgi:hypothetical protein
MPVALVVLKATNKPKPAFGTLARSARKPAGGRWRAGGGKCLFSKNIQKKVKNRIFFLKFIDLMTIAGYK